jgi:hypothetical protein
LLLQRINAFKKRLTQLNLLPKCHVCFCLPWCSSSSSIPFGTKCVLFSCPSVKSWSDRTFSSHTSPSHCGRRGFQKGHKWLDKTILQVIQNRIVGGLCWQRAKENLNLQWNRGFPHFCPHPVELVDGRSQQSEQSSSISSPPTTAADVISRRLYKNGQGGQVISAYITFLSNLLLSLAFFYTICSFCKFEFLLILLCSHGQDSL